MAMLKDLPIGDIDPAPDNPRSDLGDVDSLAESIKHVGVLQPVTVYPHPTDEGRWMLRTGHRRLAAATLAGLDKVPAVVTLPGEPVGNLAAERLVENLQREDLTPTDEARAFAAVVSTSKKEGGLSRRALAATIGKSATYVRKRLALLDVPTELGAMVDAGKVPAEAAVLLASAIKSDGLDEANAAAVAALFVDQPYVASAARDYGAEMIRRTLADQRHAEAAAAWRASFGDQVLDAIPDGAHKVNPYAVPELNTLINDHKDASDRIDYRARLHPITPAVLPGAVLVADGRHVAVYLDPAAVEAAPAAYPENMTAGLIDPDQGHERGAQDRDRRRLKAANTSRSEAVAAIIAGKAPSRAAAGKVAAWRVIDRATEGEKAALLKRLSKVGAFDLDNDVRTHKGWQGSQVPDWSSTIADFADSYGPERVAYLLAVAAHEKRGQWETTGPPQWWQDTATDRGGWAPAGVDKGKTGKARP